MQLDFFFLGGWILEGDFFWRNICLGNIFFLEYFEGDFLGERELHTKKSKGAFGCISGVVRLLESLMVRFIHRRMSISISHLPVQKLCHVLYPFLCKLQYLTNLQFPERREINHQTNFLQNKKNTTNIIPNLFLQNKYIFKFQHKIWSMTSKRIAKSNVDTNRWYLGHQHVWNVGILRVKLHHSISTLHISDITISVWRTKLSTHPPPLFTTFFAIKASFSSSCFPAVHFGLQQNKSLGLKGISGFNTFNT